MLGNRRIRPTVLVLAVTASLLSVGSGPATATITPTTDAAAAAGAILTSPGDLVSAEFTGAALAHAISDTPLAGFPTDGDSYLVLSTGTATAIDQPEAPGTHITTDWGTTSPHPDPQGATPWGPADSANVHDLVSLELHVDVPDGADCMAFDSRFLSEELGQSAEAFLANDGYKAFVTTPSTSWGNVVFDELGNRVEVLSSKADVAAYGADHAIGTAFGGGTTTLTSVVPVVPGATTIRFVLYDAIDGTFDSAVLIDRLRVYDCTPPVPVEVTGPAKLAVGKTADYSVAVTNPTDGELPLDSLIMTTPPGAVFESGSATGLTTTDPELLGGLPAWTGLGTLAAGDTATLGLTLRGLQAGSGQLGFHASVADLDGDGDLPVTVVPGSTSTTAKVTTVRRKVKVAGVVAPENPGTDVAVTLFRKEKGSFRKVTTRRDALDDASRYGVTFKRPPQGRCKVVARFAGNSDYRSSTVTKKFHC